MGIRFWFLLFQSNKTFRVVADLPKSILEKFIDLRIVLVSIIFEKNMYHSQEPNFSNSIINSRCILNLWRISVINQF